MKDFLQGESFAFMSETDRQFIYTFDEAMNSLGYDFGDKIGSGYCWGRWMLIYTKTGVKSKQVFARIYLREDGFVLRFFFSDIDNHREFIENAPSHIKEVFVGEYGKCKHCHNEKNGKCRFRKTYTIDGRLIEKCNGFTFEFHQPTLAGLPDYLALFSEFYPSRRP